MNTITRHARAVSIRCPNCGYEGAARLVRGSGPGHYAFAAPAIGLPAAGGAWVDPLLGVILGCLGLLVVLLAPLGRRRPRCPECGWRRVAVERRRRAFRRPGRRQREITVEALDASPEDHLVDR